MSDQDSRHDRLKQKLTNAGVPPDQAALMSIAIADEFTDSASSPTQVDAGTRGAAGAGGLEEARRRFGTDQPSGAPPPDGTSKGIDEARRRFGDRTAQPHTATPNRGTRR